MKFASLYPDRWNASGWNEVISFVTSLIQTKPPSFTEVVCVFFICCTTEDIYQGLQDQDFYLVKSVVSITWRCEFFSNMFVFVSYFELENPLYLSFHKN